MGNITDAFKAPFSAESAAKTTPKTIALVWGVSGAVGVLLLRALVK